MQENSKAFMALVRFGAWFVATVLIALVVGVVAGVALLAGATGGQAMLLWLGGVITGALINLYGVARYKFEGEK